LKGDNHMSHKLNLVLKSQEEKIVRTAEQVSAGAALGKKIHALIQEHLAELGAAICEGKPYEKRNGSIVTPYSVQGTINMPPLTFDDGSGDQSTYASVLNFRFPIPELGGAKAANAGTAPIVRAMTLLERRNQRKG
jgi:hypothetical protein